MCVEQSDSTTSYHVWDVITYGMRPGPVITLSKPLTLAYEYHGVSQLVRHVFMYCLYIWVIYGYWLESSGAVGHWMKSCAFVQDVSHASITSGAMLGRRLWYST